MVVDQARVDAFAECTEDHQWIHRAGAATPFGGPIAHGFLTLSLLPSLCKDVLPRHAWVASEVNCGFNRTRFVSPVALGWRQCVVRGPKRSRHPPLDPVVGSSPCGCGGVHASSTVCDEVRSARTLKLGLERGF